MVDIGSVAGAVEPVVVVLVLPVVVPVDVVPVDVVRVLTGTIPAGTLAVDKLPGVAGVPAP
jgi:hypothetical protein